VLSLSQSITKNMFVGKKILEMRVILEEN